MLATLLIVVAAGLLLALAAGLRWQRGRSARAVPPGPRTVAELVSRRAAGGRPVEATVDAAPTPVAVVSGPAVVSESETPRPAEPEAVRSDPPVPVAADEPVRHAPDLVHTGAGAVTSFGDDAPWRRAGHMAGGRPDPVLDAPRAPALSLLRPTVRREPAPLRASSIAADAPAAPVLPAAAVAEVPEPPSAVVTPVAMIPDTDPDVLFDSPRPAEVPQPASRPHDASHLAAEQAAADLALLRTFGPADLASRPERAPVVALEGRGRPAAAPTPGVGQPVRFRAVRRDGSVIPDTAVALLDDLGREISVDKADADGTGELLAPHPGRFVLVATAADHQPGAVTLTVGDAPVVAEVLLVRSASLVGLVSGEDGPIEGARVTLVQDGEVVETADTDPDGRYRVPDMAAGEYALSVAAAGCDAHVVLVSVPDETELVHDAELDPAGRPA